MGHLMHLAKPWRRCERKILNSQKPKDPDMAILQFTISLSTSFRHDRQGIMSLKYDIVINHKSKHGADEDEIARC